MSFDAARQSFVSESRELLGELEASLLTCERSGTTPELLDVIFRAAHTLKGNASLFDFDSVVSFTHRVESVLDQARSGALDLDHVWLVVLLECRDYLAALIDAIAEGRDGSDAQLQVWGRELLGRIGALQVSWPPESAMQEGALLSQAIACIRALLDRSGDAGAAIRDATELLTRVSGAAPEVPADPVPAGPRAASDTWHVSVRFHAEVLLQGLDPIPFVHYLSSLGSIEGLALVTDALPPWQAFDAETSYLGYEIRLRSAASQTQIEDVFQFVKERATLTVLPPHASLLAYAALLESLPEGVERAVQLLTECGSLSAAEAMRAIGHDEAHAGQEAYEAPADGEARSYEAASIRVDVPKLERLVDLVGELATAGTATNRVAQSCHSVALEESTSRLGRLIEEVREQVLKLRMMPLGTTFTRFQRLVRDTARELGKEIRLETSGAETELDKALIEKITAPLTHLVRNAIDHGIEPTAQRRAVGKPTIGTVGLHAYHDSGAVIIEVIDDGAGLDRERILAKARAQGRGAADQDLSDMEVNALLFEPGFSTAAAVTDLSGRGVGLDVVKRNVLAARGEVEIESQAGAGTTVRIRLPLTLAIIDGFLVRAASSAFVIPLDMVEECVEPQQVAEALESGQRYIEVRGQALPIVCLREHFQLAGDGGKRANVVIVRNAGGRAGLLVDELLGERQAVIKPLSPLFRNVRGLGGSTILGDGTVALIVDVGGLIEQCARSTALVLEYGMNRETERSMWGEP